MKRLWIYLLLIMLGVSMPLWFGPEQIGLTNLLTSLREEYSGNSLMLAAFVVVLLNTIRALPHYIGAFLLGDELGERFNNPWLKILVPILIIPLVYVSINTYTSLQYHFGGPAVILLVSIVLLQFFSKGRLRPFTKSLILVLLLFGVQWLDVVPMLSTYGFGHGPVSTEIKQIALTIEFTKALSLYSLLLSLIFIVTAVILAIYLVVSEQKRQIKLDLHRVNVEALQSRATREVMYLVHDLKTPLSTIGGLNSLIAMKSVDQKIQEYTEHISNAVEVTSEMVSEMLYAEKKNWYSLKSLIDYIKATRLTEESTPIFLKLEADENSQVFMNKIRMTRAVANLIDNANEAVADKEDGHVTVLTRCKEQAIWIGVKDNGRGISQKELKKIWRAGYSTKAHPGIGLSFVQTVIKEHQAELYVKSERGVGTIFWIKFARESVVNENFNH